MSEISTIIGQRIKNYRLQLGLSQEKVAELSGCHPTYIGQVERGEKNATLESVEKISVALGVPLSKLFDKYVASANDDIPSKCYELLLSKSKKEQEQIYRILLELDKYKATST
ncbi:MAG: helix-turn-helix domain-containing protein [Faecousia sp.]